MSIQNGASTSPCLLHRALSHTSRVNDTPNANLDECQNFREHMLYNKSSRFKNLMWPMI